MKSEKSFNTRFVVPTLAAFMGYIYHFSQIPELNQENPPLPLMLDMIKIGVILGLPISYDIAKYQASKNNK